MGLGTLIGVGGGNRRGLSGLGELRDRNRLERRRKLRRSLLKKDNRLRCGLQFIVFSINFSNSDVGIRTMYLMAEAPEGVEDGVRGDLLRRRTLFGGERGVILSNDGILFGVVLEPFGISSL